MIYRKIKRIGIYIKSFLKTYIFEKLLCVAMFVQGFILIGLLVKEERVHIYIHIIIDILRMTGIFILFISIIVK